MDSDGEIMGFENLVYSVFEFIHGLIDTARFRSTVKKAMNDLLYYILLYMQITSDQVSYIEFFLVGNVGSSLLVRLMSKTVLDICS